MENNPNTQNERDLVGRQGGQSSSASATRGGVREGWENLKQRITGKWSNLNADELDRYQGRSRNDLVGYIGDTTRTDRNLVERDVDTFARDTNYRWD